MREATIGACLVRVLKDDISALDIEAFVYAARPDLVLGAGFGAAIAQRGGPTIQAELKTLAPIAVTQAVVTAAGKLKAKHVVHVVVPRFQEEDLERKLAESTRNALRAADERGIRRLALPPLGTGFYGIPLDACARLMMAAIAEHARGMTGLEEIDVCVLDTYEIAPFERELQRAASRNVAEAGR